MKLPVAFQEHFLRSVFYNSIHLPSICYTSSSLLSMHTQFHYSPRFPPWYPTSPRKLIISFTISSIYMILILIITPSLTAGLDVCISDKNRSSQTTQLISSPENVAASRYRLLSRLGNTLMTRPLRLASCPSTARQLWYKNNRAAFLFNVAGKIILGRSGISTLCYELN
jgi:hypothetical protein